MIESLVFKDWHSISTKKVLGKLDTQTTGLSNKEARKRFRDFGSNSLPQKSLFSFFSVIFNQFKNPLVYVLVFGGLIAYSLGELIDGSVIFAAIFISVIVGVIQEYKASQALIKLKNYIKPQAKVLRDGKEEIILASELVPGDIMLLEAGDKISADARIIKSNELTVIEAALTGESMPSIKKDSVLETNIPLADRGNMVYMGTIVDRGNAEAIVTATGIKTEIGKVAILVSEIKEESTPLQKNLEQLGKTISVLFVVLSLLILVSGLLQEKSFIEMLLTAIAVAVAAIPEGLPAVLVITLAIGMQKILAKKGLVRKLIAAETLGSTTIICADKTGTLTLGQMEVGGVRTFDKELSIKNSFSVDAKELLKISVFCNDAMLKKVGRRIAVIGESTEKALALAGISKKINKHNLEKIYPRIGEVPFSSERKYMAVLVQENKKIIPRPCSGQEKQKNKNTIYVKGAPEEVLKRSSFYIRNGQILKLNLKTKREFEKQYLELARRGLRVLGLAYKDTGRESISDKDVRGLVFGGLVFLKDPLRKQAKHAIITSQKAGIKVVVITGDHKLTAQAIASEVGIIAKNDEIMEGRDIDKLSKKEFFRKINNIKIFARVTPAHKLQIIEAFSKHNEVVAMTGDGVNDAPALKAADIGVALGSGTDVAKEVSDLILLDDNLTTLVTAISQGRNIFENIRKVVLYLLSNGFTEILLIGGSLAFSMPMALLPAQILWINIVTDIFPGVALSFEPEEKINMREPPRDKGDPILNAEMKILISVVGIVSSVVFFIIYLWLWKKGFNIDHIRTFVFAAIGVNSIMFVFACRSFRYTIFSKNLFSNWALLLAFALGLITLLVSVYIPFFQKILSTVSLGWREWLALIVIGLFNIILIEIMKWIFIVKNKNNNRNKFNNK